MSYPGSTTGSITTEADNACRSNIFKPYRRSVYGMKLVPDTSVVIDGRVSERVATGEWDGATILVPEAVVSELEHQANIGLESGWNGIEELSRLADLVDAGKLSIEYIGRSPTPAERDGANRGEIDGLIRELAKDESATFVTSDIVQSEVAQATGIAVEYIAPKVRTVDALDIERYFDDQTMSVHLKQGVRPMAKRGSVGDMRFEEIESTPLSESELVEMAREIEHSAKQASDGFIEISEPGMTIVQFRDYRIAMAEPPFSEGIEITAVRPLVKTTLADYSLADELRNRLRERHRGVLIAGAPGAGKSTFAQAVAEFLSQEGHAVKTMEKPRDLQVGPEITQYTALGGSMEATADALLMVRPDYTIYDEVRKTADFSVFGDMRLAGVGMVGVVHATRAIDALQRLVGRVELGLIPQIVDTVVYIEAGDVHTVYDVVTEVKVPHGLTEEDLARPVIVIRDFETNRPAYEIYTFNRQVVTVPIDGEQTDSGVDRLARGEIEREIRAIAHGHVDVELTSGNQAIVYVDESAISQVIGKGGGRISQIEDRLGMHIDVRSHAERPERSPPATDAPAGTPAGNSVTPEVTNSHVILQPPGAEPGDTVEVKANNEYLFTATVGRGGEIQVSRGSAIAAELEQAIDRRQQITITTE